MKILVILFFMCLGFFCKAQPDDFLFMNTWYLEQLEINGSVYSIPNNPEVYNAILDFNDTTPYTFNIEVCNNLAGEITYPNIDIFQLPIAPAVSGTPCTETENIEFENVLFDFFRNFIEEDFEYLTAIVDPDPPNYYVFIEAPNGDLAIFTEMPNPLLNIESKKQKQFFVYPNPVSEKLSIRSRNKEEMSHFKLYSLQGAMLYQGNDSSISFQGLASGIYILEISTKNGMIQRERIIKK